jgi:hypothetical protein
MASTRGTRKLATGVLGAVVAVALIWLAGSTWAAADTGSPGTINPAAVIAQHAGPHGIGWGVLHHHPGVQRPAVVHGGPLPGAMAATAGIAVLLLLLATGLPQHRHPRRQHTVWLPTMRGPPAVTA